jgi:hypothetical protein
MDKLNIDPTDNSPAIDFDFAAGRFAIAGESYPENVAAFFGPVLERLSTYLESKSDGAITFSFEMIYFNSSTAKVLMEIFDVLEDTAGRGVDVTVNWRHDAEDDTMKELGEEFGEDLVKVTFNLVEIEG